MAVDFKSIWYNPARGAYEGRVDIHRNGRSFRYPCSVSGPADMPEGLVRHSMLAQARRMSDSGPSAL